MILFVGGILSADVPTLRWAADTGSGAPNVFYEDGDLSRLVGFERDVMERIAWIIGSRAVFVQNDWDALIPGLQRNLYDVVINGIVPFESRQQAVLFSKPYYACSLALVVRASSVDIGSVLDCNGLTVGVLQNARSEVPLTENLKAVKIIGYPDEYCALSDLGFGRVDAIVLDSHIAAYYVKRMPHLKIVDEFGDIKYAIVLAKGNDNLLADVNAAIDAMKRDGSLRAIVAKWGVGNANYERLFSPMDGASWGPSALEPGRVAKGEPSRIGYAKVVPFFLKAACVTLLLSILAMCVAIAFGLGLAIVRVYTPKWISFVAVFTIEFLRGTPLLIQLFFMFYGLPRLGIILEPIATGVLTLGLNYAAYEAENFRAGMAAVPYGQMEAARALGMSQWQSLRHIILPQAVIFILPPLTNDFIALLKDSSLVSLITIVELTKTYTTVASNSFDFFGTGIIVAVIYFLIGFPFVRIARWAEKYMKLERRAYSSRRIGRM